ncbi:MAG: EAL domain-containing protein [Gammaproteobacteria bacterium]|nr:EAL domain-containing protein [Gammaproteobacteria bacterium]
MSKGINIRPTPVAATGLPDNRLAALAYISAQPDLASLIKNLAHVLSPLSQAQFCALSIFDEAEQELSTHHLFGHCPSFIGQRALDITKRSDDASYYLDSFEDMNLLTIPLMVSGNPIGAIFFGQKKNNEFDENIVGNLHAVTYTLALAVDRFMQEQQFDTLSSKLYREIQERQRDGQTLMNIVQGVGAEIGNNFFLSVVEHLSDALSVRYAYIGELINDGSHIRTIAVCKDGKHIDNFEYRIERHKTNACQGNTCFCEDSVKHLLPGQNTQQQMHVKSCWALPLTYSGGKTIGVLVVMHDKEIEREDNILPVMKIFAARTVAEMERISTEERLFMEKERAQITLSSMSDGVITTDAHGLVEYLNPNAERMLGWSSEEACRQPVQDIFNILDETTGKSIFALLNSDDSQAALSAHHSRSATLLTRQGEELHVACTFGPIKQHDDSIVGNVLVFHNNSTFKNLIDKVSYQASHDALTGIYNRHEFEKVLQKYIDASHKDKVQHVLLFLDVDHFKVINDTSGHTAGDELLRQVSSLMLESVQQGDLVARIGGDEFAILLQNTSIDAAKKAAESIRHKIHTHLFVREGRSFKISASIGLMPINADSGNLSEVLSSADAACYLAKHRGRNTVYIYKPDDLSQMQYKNEMQWATRIHLAIEEDQFCLFRQKIMSLHDSGRDTPRHEILLRLREPDGNIVSPMSFIPIAERFKLMPVIDQWVIRKVFEYFHVQMQNAGVQNDCYTINLSGQSLESDDVLCLILGLTEELHVDPSKICFEITETAAIENLSNAKRFIQRLKDEGFQFALDDFGAGMSSFTYLKHLPVNYLKIDGEFIRDIKNNSVDKTLVDSIHRIASAMGIKTIAEFVECQETLELLRELGIDFAQGFVIAKPQPFYIPSKDSTILASTLTCPECGHSEITIMPTNSCQYYHECKGCNTMLKPKKGQCCVFCSYGTMPCPDVQKKNKN